MKELLGQYASYNHWANQLVTQSIMRLPEEKHHQAVPGSFPSLYSTVLHMWDAESVWWQRMKLHERLIAPSDASRPVMQETVNGLLNQSALWEDWVLKATEMQLTHVFAYQNSRKEQFKQPIAEMVMHVFNHGTYHRGQLVAMMRALGETKLPATDFILYCRKKK
ncbi:MAG: hypothetical protein MUE58_02300 [Chitinophagaceae bacterium]|nr:hypothetical protein [Chitinophagaceae bacterium]